VTIQKIDYPNNGGMSRGENLPPRIETGAVQFGDDWPGYFVRGDGAMNLAMQINTIERALGLFNSNHMTKQEFLNLVWLPMMEVSGLKQSILGGGTIVGMDTTALQDGSDWREFPQADEPRHDHELPSEDHKLESED